MVTRMYDRERVISNLDTSVSAEYTALANLSEL